MKQFLKNFLSSLLALFVFSALIIVLLVALVIGISASTTEKKTVNEKSVLVINTNTIINDRDEEDDLKYIFDEQKNLGITTFKHIIADAKNNPNIKAILIKSKGNVNGFTILDKMTEVLNDFKSSGKKIYAYGNYDERSYFLSSVAHKIYAEPAGYFLWNGIGSQTLFYKKLMDKYEIKAQIFYAGKFKSATEPFRRENMSDENKLQIKELLNEFIKEAYNKIAKNRGIKIETLKNAEQTFQIKNLSDAQKLGFIDGVLFSDEIESVIKKEIGQNITDKLELVNINDYEMQDNVSEDGDKKEVAVIYANGIIAGDNTDQDGYINTQELIKSIREAAKDEDIKAIVLRINSPGGDAQASEKIWRAVQLAQKQKLLIVSMGSVAASGGYYIAMGAEKIFAEPFTITGSIGVFAMIPNLQSFLSKHLGITYDHVGTSPNANFNILNPLTTQQAAFIQNHIDSTYLLFKQRVMKARNINAQQVENVAQGRVWSAKQAIQNKLIDTIGNLYATIDFLKQKLGCAKIKMIEFPKQKNTFDRILKQINKKVMTYFDMQQQLIAQPELQKIIQQYGWIKNKSNYGNALMQMPFLMLEN